MAQGSVAFNLTDSCLCLVIFFGHEHGMSFSALYVLPSLFACEFWCLSRGESITVLCCLWITICICMYSVLSFINPQLSALVLSDAVQVTQILKSKYKSSQFPFLPKLTRNLSIATNYFPRRKQLKEFLFVFSNVFKWYSVCPLSSLQFCPWFWWW